MELPLRWKVFATVALRLSFSKAAEDLFISQPAVTKHIKELENELGLSLFERNGNRTIHLTSDGNSFKAFMDKVSVLYQEFEAEIQPSIQALNGEIKVGASSTVGQYILPVLLAKFHKRFPQIRVKLQTGNTEDIIDLLRNGKIAFAITEGIGFDRSFQFDNFIKDEIVLVCSAKSKSSNLKKISVTSIPSYPLVLRESGSGTLEVVKNYLHKNGVDLKNITIEIELGNSESIIRYLKQSETFGFISVYAILDQLKQGELQIIDLKEGSIDRIFRFVQKIGPLSPLAKILKDFIKRENRELLM